MKGNGNRSIIPRYRKVVVPSTHTGFYPFARWINNTLSDEDYLRSGAEYLVIEEPDTAYTCKDKGDKRVGYEGENNRGESWK